jgi:hypothetical protein
MKLEVLVVFALAASAAAKTYTVLTFGDSWGQLGPSWKVIRDAFKKNGVPAEVKSSAVSATTACQWAVNGNALVRAAKNKFPHLTDGPDFVWYTAGGNDMIYDLAFGRCTKRAKSIEAAEVCTDTATKKVLKCTEKLLDNYWKAFPKSQVMQDNYDVPCENRACWGMDAGYMGAYCGKNITCLNTMAQHWVNDYIGALQKKYPQPQYTAVHIEGVGQALEGDVKASVGKVDVDRSGVCDQMLMCVHPRYGSKYATAVGDAFWNLFFSKYTTKDDTTVV